MNKTLLMKTLVLAWILIAGWGNAQAAVYDWIKVADLSQIQSGDSVVLADESKSIALPNNNSRFTGVSVTIKDGSIAGRFVNDDIYWIVTKNSDGTLSFSKPGNSMQLCGVMGDTPKFEVGAISPPDFVTNFTFDDYGENGGEMRYLFSNYLKWENVDGNYRAVVRGSGDKITLFKRTKMTYVKWKRVTPLPSNITTDDLTLIVDLTSKNAMKNNPAYEEGNTVSNEAPGAMKVTIKEELDRVTSEIGDSLVWTAVNSYEASDEIHGGTAHVYPYQFYMTNNEGSRRYLFNSDQSLRVGFVSESDASKRKFDLDNHMLHQKVETDNNVFSDYHVGVKKANIAQSFMGGDSWDLAKAETSSNNPVEIKPNADVIDTQTAFFIKVVTDLPDPTLRFPGHDYEADVQHASEFQSPVATVEEDPNAHIVYYRDNSFSDIADVDVNTGQVTVKKRGTIRIYAQVYATEEYDNYLTSYILRIDDTSLKGSRVDPFTVAEAIAFAKDPANEEEISRGTCYFVKGIVSSVGGLLAGMDDMEEMMEMMSDMMDSFNMEGFDINSMMSMFLGEQEPGTVTYAISDNGVDRDSLSVINGRGLQLADITTDSLSVGDWVTAYGPLEYSEDKDMMSQFTGGGGQGDQEKKKTVKMPPVNYMQEHRRNLITEDVILYFGQTKGPEELFEITDLFGGTLITSVNTTRPDLTYTSLKPSETNVAEWVLVAENDSLLTPKMEGIITVTVKAPVLLQPGDTIKMKRRFNLDVRDRRLLPAGTMVGHYELVTNINQLQPDDKLLIVATVDNKSKVLNRKTGASGGGSNPLMSIFGSGNGTNITINDDGTITEVPENALIMTLEQAGDKWRMQTGRTTDYVMTYLYVSDSGNNGYGGGGSIPGLGGAKVKRGTEAAVGDSCLVSFTFHPEMNDSVTIQFNFSDPEGGETSKAKNVIRYSSSMMSSSFGGYEEDSEKATLPRLYRLVRDKQFDVTISSALWATIVTYYDVNLPEGLTGCTVKAVHPSIHKASVSDVASLKAGEPYLLKADAPGVYTLTKNTEGVAKPEINLLKISDDTTGDGAFVLANKSNGVGFYKWSGGLLGAGRVYLEVSGESLAPAYYTFDFDSATGIEEITKDQVQSTIYDLSGRRVAQPTKGLYIMNGKKVFIQ